MAEERFEPREIDWRQWFPWTQLFRSFQVALDPRKLLLAAGGILVMAVGWWLLAVVFDPSRSKHTWPTDYLPADYEKEATATQSAEQLAWNAFKRERNQWNLRYECAGSSADESTDAGDLANSPAEFQEIQKHLEQRERTFMVNGRLVEVRPKPYGQLRTWPWFEDRGPNPYLLVRGKAGHPNASGSARHVPWQRGEFPDWFLQHQVPVLLEPLVKFLRPVFYLLEPNVGFVEGLYLLLVIGWTLGTWAIFGGAITRMAAVQIARNEKIGLGESIRFTLARWRSYTFASFAFLLGIAFFVVLLSLFGVVHLIPVVAEFWDGILWPIVLLLGLLMALLMVGLVGWPMIHATLSTEGSDSFDALSRSLSYVYQRPWSYLWYCAVAVAYGAAVVFFVGLMGSLMVYLGKWGVSLTPGITFFKRDPSYLFYYAPTSFGWRELLLEGSPAFDDLKRWNYIGASLVAFWLYLVFLMIVGFGYSYFWSASTIIYLLMRRKVDDTDFDEVYLEEEDADEAYTPPPPSAPGSSTGTTGTTGLQMVEPPALIKQPANTPEATEGAATKTGERTGPAADGAGS